MPKTKLPKRLHVSIATLAFMTMLSAAAAHHNAYAATCQTPPVNYTNIQATDLRTI